MDQQTPLPRTLGKVGPWLACCAAASLGFLALLMPSAPIPTATVPGPGDLPRANVPYPMPPELQGVDLLRQTAAEASAKSSGCVACHKEACDPHRKDTLRIGCTDCHGGDASTHLKEQAHPQPRFPAAWKSSANPVRSYTLLNHERPEFIRFVNPGDLRVAHISCGTVNCHPKEVLQTRKSMMTHGCMLWGAALYNNGAIPRKRAQFGEAYSMHGVPLALQTVPPPDEWEQCKKGVLPRLDPLPRFEIGQPGNILRIFERGGKFRPEIGIPEVFEDSGRPILSRLSIRGLGTQNRVDPTLTGLNKTRLFDPTLNFMGTNDQPGDYRSSGCTACHVLYANDRSRVHSGPYAVYGNKGRSFDKDPTIPKDESGHPIAHAFAPGNGVPTSQCMVCHIHPGTTVMNSYTGFMWWDEETDGHLIYPPHEKNPTAEEAIGSLLRNPNMSAARSKLSDPAFVADLAELNKHAGKTQFADYHGHGWAFRAVFRQDREGKLLDHWGKPVGLVDNELLQRAVRFQKMLPQERKHEPGVPVHLMDIHLEKGMHCIDCHFVQDMHGNTKLQGEVRAAIEIQCVDCHGTVDRKATLRTSGPAAYTSSREGGRDLAAMRAPNGRRRFERIDGKVWQNSMVEKGLCWEVPQTMDTVDPKHPRYNAKSAAAKTVRWGAGGKLEYGCANESEYAHRESKMSCIACHSSWNPSCYGCHLPQKANVKTPMLHAEGDVTRNIIEYNFQTLRDEVYMLARDGDVTGNRIGPARSSCAVHVGSYNANRESIYVQQQTISSCGQSGIAFSTNVPHTVRGKDGTKQCSDCHLSDKNDNNALMAQLLMHGTGYLNFVGRYAWVAAGTHGVEAPIVTERDEPQTVIGSTMHKLAYPDRYKKHLEHGKKLKFAHEHPGKDISEQLLKPWLKADVKSLLARGEYLYAACGEAGLRVYDIAFIDHKGFSERIATAPVSPCGQRFFVKTKNAAAVAAPTTIAPDPTRADIPENKEQKVHAMYGYIYVADKEEGLILVGAGTLLDGNPLNNFLKRDVTFNPDGILKGAKALTIAGTCCYVCCDAGLVVVDIDDPKCPKVTAVLGGKYLKKPHAVQVQFRYAFVCDDHGLNVLDVTDLRNPKPVTKMKLPEAHNVYLARTRAYVAGGKKGLVIVDITNPENPKVEQCYDAHGEMNDVHDVKLGITYTSLFAYVADGKHGLRVVQLTSPDTPGNGGFSPRPTPCLIATYKLAEGAKAYAVSRGLDRDRAVDEAGNQIAVFGRLGARPMNAEEQRKLWLKGGKPWTVSDDPATLRKR
ncbi:MAG: hypothetical protein K2W96_15395 [Gemmataceae bacterium]|nr:hypothetical protein [Gemmataceae bacterium]